MLLRESVCVPYFLGYLYLSIALAVMAVEAARTLLWVLTGRGWDIGTEHNFMSVS